MAGSGRHEVFMQSFDVKAFGTKKAGRCVKRLLRSASAMVALAAIFAFPAPAFADISPPIDVPATDDGEPFPTLAQAIELAEEHAPDVVSARMNVGVANASYASARLAPLDNPYLEVFTDRGRGGATRDVTVQANLWIPIEVSGQRVRRLAEADALVSWQRANVEATRWLAKSDAVRAYGGVIVAAARLNVLGAIVDVAQAEAELYAARLAAGDATLQDERLAKVELGRTTILLEESRADLARAIAHLARLTGHLFATPAPMSVHPPPPSKRIDAALAERLAEGSAHVQAKEQEADYFARERDRAAIEAHTPVNIIVTAGRGDLGEMRFGGGLSWTFPLLRRNQSAQARAEAERIRALAEADVQRNVLAATLRGLNAERANVRRALEALDNLTDPAAQDSVQAAVATRAAGKGDSLRVLTARRDLAMVRLRKLELVAREWSIVGDIVALTGELP